MNKDWWQKSAKGIPHIVSELPGPKSKSMSGRASRYVRGLSSQVQLFPVCFEKGQGITLTDVDGNTFELRVGVSNNQGKNTILEDDGPFYDSMVE